MPIYYLNGDKVADDYADFYDGSWDTNRGRNIAGNLISGNPYIWTGTDSDGYQFRGSYLGHTDMEIRDDPVLTLGGYVLGNIFVDIAALGQKSGLSVDKKALIRSNAPMFGLSEVFTVAVPVEVTLTLIPDSISENGGSTKVRATIPSASLVDTTVTVSAAAVSPAVAADFSLSANKTLTIAAGTRISSDILEPLIGSGETVRITAVDNNVDAPDKSITVSAVVANSRNGTRGPPADVTLTIEDDEEPPTVSGTPAVTTDEDTAYTFSADDFNFSDTNNDDTLASVKVTALPANGTLQLDVTAIASSDLPKTVTRAEIDANKLTYTPPSNANGTPYTTFTFKVSDGTDDSAEATMTVNVAAVNDAPTSAGGTVTTDEDTAYTFSADDFNFSDIDTGDALVSVNLTSLPGRPDKCNDDDDDDDDDECKGDLLFKGDSIYVPDFWRWVVSKAEIDAGYLTYTPLPKDANGTPYTTFMFKVNDGTVDSAEATMTVNVAAVNDAPTSADGTVSTNEDTTYTFKEDDFSFFDVEVGERLTLITISGLPELEPDRGTFWRTIQGNPFTLDPGRRWTYHIQSIRNGTLNYTPPSDANGTPYITFTFSVYDTYGLNSRDYTMKVNVAAVNDAPTTPGGTVTTDEDTAYTFKEGDFNFSDIDTGDTLASVKVTALPVNGTLQLDGAAIASGNLPQTVTRADIDADKLIYTPPSNANGTPYTTFKFKVSDATADSAEATMTVNVTAVKDAPTPADGTVSTNEDTTYTFKADDFNFSDTDTGDALASVKVTALPANGTLQLDGAAIASGDLPQTLTRVDIDREKLTYTPPSNANGTPYTTFKFKVSDGTADSAEATMTVNVAAVNDAPTSADGTVSTNEDTAYTFSADDFSFSDIDTGDALAGVKVTALPANGTLQLDGTAIASGDLPQTVTKADIDADKLTYTPPSNANGTPYTTFTFKVSDGTDDSAEATMTVNVAAVNDAPTSADGTVSTNEDTAYTFKEDDFSFSDVVEGDKFTFITVSGLPEPDRGTFRLTSTRRDTITLVPGRRLTLRIQSIRNGILTYTPPSNANGTPYTTFKFSVHDTYGLNSRDYTMTVNVAAVRDAPTVSGTPAVTTDEDTAYTFKADDFSFSDIDTGDALAGVKVTALPANGKLQLDGAAIASGDLPQTVTRAEIDANKLIYTLPSNANGTPYTTFKFKVSDGTDDSAEATMTVNVAAVNDAPTVSGTPAVTTNEDMAYTFSADDFNFSDIDTGDALAGVKVHCASGHRQRHAAARCHCDCLKRSAEDGDQGRD